MHRPLLSSLLLIAIAASSLTLCLGCSKPQAPPKVEESCPSLTQKYLQCVKGAEPDDEAIEALKALSASILTKCEAISAAEATAAKAPDADPNAPRLVACANASCDEINDCLKAATPAPTDASPPNPDQPSANP